MVGRDPPDGDVFFVFFLQCSARCGGGVKTREVTCQQVLALGQVAVKAGHLCGSDRPAETKPCNAKSCDGRRPRPKIVAVDQQNFVQPVAKKKVSRPTFPLRFMFFRNKWRIGVIDYGSLYRSLASINDLYVSIMVRYRSLPIIDYRHVSI